MVFVASNFLNIVNINFIPLCLHMEMLIMSYGSEATQTKPDVYA